MREKRERGMKRRSLKKECMRRHEKEEGQNAFVSFKSGRETARQVPKNARGDHPVGNQKKGGGKKVGERDQEKKTRRKTCCDPPQTQTE